MYGPRPRYAPGVVTLALTSFSESPLAHGPMGWGELGRSFDLFFGSVVIVVGAVVILFSALLGLVSWRLAVRMGSEGTAPIFGRGFIALSSILGFLLGALTVIFGFASRGGFRADAVSPVFILVVLDAGLFFLAAELVIAAGLYTRVARDQGSGFARFLAVLSYASALAVGGAFLFGLLVTAMSLVDALGG